MANMRYTLLAGQGAQELAKILWGTAIPNVWPVASVNLDTCVTLKVTNASLPIPAQEVKSKHFLKSGND